MRKSVLVCMVSMLVASALAQPNASVEKTEDTSFKAQWKDGLRLETSDKSFEVQIGGRIHNDWAFGEGGDSLDAQFGEFEDGTEFRRARLSFSGRMYEKVEFKTLLDFATGNAAFRDVYLGLRKLAAVGNIRFGQFKEPLGLEEQASSNFITFMERSLANAFVPSRHTGIMIHDRELAERVSWALGVFKDTNDVGLATGDENYAVTGRVTGLPWFEEDGRRLVHLGVAYSRRNTASVFRFRERPETHLAPRLVDTGVFPAEALNLVATETAVVFGPASMQAEYVRADSDARTGLDSSFDGFYVYGSFFLTGEHRSYRTSEAAFTRIRPRKSFLSKEGGPGAWEVAVRYSRIDLDDAPIQGGELKDWTAGLNWYLNPNTRIMWNYVRADLENRGTADIFQMRFQVDF
ncbi:MAG: porin [Acidobacteria bacterium]|nr:MAG: porin [Acidobacteriota bacterium]